MSWQATAYVAEIVEGITRSEKLVLLVLANRHNPDTARCDLSLGRIAKESLLQPRRIEDLLKSLEKKRFIRIQRRPGFTNQYWFRFDDTPAEIAGVPDDDTPAISDPEPPQFSIATPAILELTPAIPRHRNRKVKPKTSEAERSEPKGAAPARRGPVTEAYLLELISEHPGIDARRELAKCRDYYASKGIRRADECATFRNWLRKADEFQARDGAAKSDVPDSARSQILARYEAMAGGQR